MYANREPWMQDAACLGTNPDDFFPDQGATSPRAIRVCESCAVRELCLEFALRTRVDVGIFGGLTAVQRSRLRKGLAA